MNTIIAPGNQDLLKCAVNELVLLNYRVDLRFSVAFSNCHNH